MPLTNFEEPWCDLFFSPLMCESIQSALNPQDLVGLVNRHLTDIVYILGIQLLINEWRMTPAIFRTLVEEYNVIPSLIIFWCCLFTLSVRSEKISLLNAILTDRSWTIIFKSKWQVIK